MNWFAETWHIFKKDALQMRSHLAVFATCIFSFAIVSCLPVALKGDSGSVMAIIVLLACIVLTTSIMHLDSPVVAAAYWRCLPVRRSSTLAAKILLIAIALFGIPMLGQTTAILGNGALPMQLASLLLPSVSELAVCLFVALVLGALSRDLKVFAVAAVGGYALFALPFFVLSTGKYANTSFAFEIKNGNVIAITVALCSFAAVALVYARPLRIHRLLLCLFAALSPTAIIAALFDEHSPADVRELQPVERVAVNVDSLRFIEGGGMGVDYFEVSFGLAAGRTRTRTWMMVTNCVAITPKREQVHLECSQGFEPINDLPPSDINTDARWLWFGSSRRAFVAVLPGTPGNIRSIVKPGTRLIFEGVVIGVNRDTVIDVAPNVTDEFRMDALRYSSRVVRPARPLTASFAARGVSVQRDWELSPQGTWRFAFSNPTRREAVEARLEIWETPPRPMILFGPVSHRGVARYRVGNPYVPESGMRDSTLAGINSTWFRDAHFIASKWVPKYKYPVRIEYVVP